MADILPFAHSTLLMLILLAGFVAMSRFGQSQALVMPLVATAFLILEGAGGAIMLRDSFVEFGPISIVFTAIAIPAHQIQRAGFFDLVGARLGGVIGEVSLRRPRSHIMLLTAMIMGITWIAAALLHNITSIMVMVPITIAICSNYRLPSRWLLCGTLIASNLGGFSTAWGDSPNLIESRVWGLTNPDFAREILPLNLIVILLLSASVTALTAWQLRREGGSLSAASKAYVATAFHEDAGNMRIDKRLLVVGLACLASSWCSRSTVTSKLPPGLGRSCLPSCSIVVLID